MSYNWFVYIVECNDLSLYTGITTDLDRRVKNTTIPQKGLNIQKARRPVKLVFSEASKDRSTASKRECEIKKLSKKQKKYLIYNN
jgi:putative endonuclease